MGTYTLYNDSLPDIKKYSYTHLSADDLRELDDGAALAPSKLRLPSYTMESGIIDAVDIDWAGIKVGDVQVESSGHLAYLISKKASGGSGGQTIENSIPILDKDMIDEIGEDNLPNKYISVPNPNEISDETTNKIYYENTGNGLYLDILFSSIRKLQSEVAKLRNSFKYGIYSFNDTDTAMSKVLADHEEYPEEEPLWATEESDLSELDCGLYLTGVGNGLDGEVISTDIDVIQLVGKVTWKDDDNSVNDAFKNNEDPKQYIFMTTSSTNLKVILREIDGNTLYTVDFSELEIPITATNKYNILFILSRNPKNYCWISVADYLTGVATVEGYYSSDGISDTRRLLDKGYYIYSVEFNDLTLYKFDTYSKKQDFTNDVEPSPAATDEDYKYSAAHITIRSVKSLDVLEHIKNQLKKNELIYIENINTLYIKTDTDVKPISGSGSGSDDTDTGMEKQEIMNWLADNGIIVADDVNGKLVLNKISDITLIHEETGKSFKFATDAEGNLRSTEISENTLAKRIADADLVIGDDANENIRGFVGMLGVAESGKRNNAAANKLNVTADVGLYSDRVKIGSFYMPREGQQSFGCSHAFIELENTSNKDFELDGCYIHLAQNTNAADDNGVDDITIYHLALEGKIPAGGTYLIRGKQYCDPNEANVFIKVNTYDKEWYVDGELIDMTRKAQNTLLLTYGYADVNINKTMYGKVTIGTKTYTGFNPHYIDSISVGKAIHTGKDTSTWYQNTVLFSNPAYDAVFKNIYELDPAKQAYQSLFSDKKDSSRVRGQSDTDFQILDLREEYIEFPATEDRIHMSIYTPKASFEGKNVTSDKTQFDMQKPNMPQCAFGIDIYKTRCFNWVSAGVFDEFVWVRQKGEENWSRFESYKDGTESDKILAYDDKVLSRVNYAPEVKGPIYSRITNILPASNIIYTAHKAIVNIEFNDSISEPKEFEYVVGRADKLGNPNPEHTSDIQTFTLYPDTYRMKIYHNTDQQGFYWIEYQAWTGAAKKMLEVIEYDMAHENIIPVLVNTGDMTQNGTRINEWLDYYNGGKCLFERFEQLAVVGNNDLCDTDVTILGTGDDNGKSNGYYFHIAFCFEIDPEIVPIANGKYMPSTYYVKDKYNALVFIDSEFTPINCQNWFGLVYDNHPVNIYTGYTMATKDDTDYIPVYAVGENKLEFEPMYDQLYRIFDKLINDQHYNPADVICACHEMPFTVVTNANLKSNSSALSSDRSINDGTSLVGSHMNRMSPYDSAAIYWFSRLIEYFRIKLMIGGHKHTYACTNILRENYKYLKNDEWVSSMIEGPMEMPSTLNPEVYTDVKWEGIDYVLGNTNVHCNTTKFPLMQYSTEGITVGADTFYPLYGMNAEQFKFDQYGGVIYFMLQATCSKLKSNKELPSNSQLFGYIIPKTNHASTGDKPYADQQYPMFAKVDLKDRYIVLCRVTNVLNDTKHVITQQLHGDGNMKIDIAKHEQDTKDGVLQPLIYGKWYKNVQIENLNADNALLTF